MTFRSNNYSEDEVRVLVEDYAELYGLRHKAFIMVRLLDLMRAMKRLSPPHLEALFYIGLAGLSLRQAGEIAGVSHDTMWRRYSRATRELVRYMNGGLR